MRYSSFNFGVAAGVLLAATACVEPTPRPNAVATPAAYQVTVAASDSAPGAGDTVHVRVLFTTTRSVSVGSFTGRVDFDPGALRFVREEPLSDGVNRLANPGAGDVRFAGISTTGFAGPVIEDIVFVATVGGARGAQSLGLVITQLGTTASADLRADLLVTSPARRILP